MTYKEVMTALESLASHDPKDLAGMARFGIKIDKAWVISIPKLRKLAKEIRKEIYNSKLKICNQSEISNVKNLQATNQALHKIALALWDSGVHEARILAGFVDEPSLVTENQMEKWVLGFDSWDVTDMVCTNLFDRTDFAVKKALEWSERKEEFVKRAGFVIMAGLAVHDKKMSDKVFFNFLKIIKREAWDERNFVRKAVNWALRQIGKSRNKNLYQGALLLAENLYQSQNKSERWIGSDAYRELIKDYIVERFN